MGNDPNLKDIFSNLDKWIDEKEKYCEKIELLLERLKKEYKSMVNKIERIPVVEKDIKDIEKSNKNTKKKEMSAKRLELSNLNNDITTDQNTLAKIMYEINDIIDGNEERKLHKGVPKKLSFGPDVISDKLLFGPNTSSNNEKSPLHKKVKTEECNGNSCAMQGGRRATRKKHRR